MNIKVINDTILPDFRIRTFYVATQKYMNFLKDWIVDKLSAPEAIRLLMSLYWLKDTEREPELDKGEIE